MSGAVLQPDATQDRSARDRHLFGPGPKRILALDGGGVRGAISIAFLERIERVLAERNGGTVRLSDHFDLIGGTSTGAIIATGLALGYSASEIKDFFFRLAPRVFRRSPWRIMGLQPRFDARNLRAELAAVIGDRKLSSDALQTGLAIVMKRADTGSPWIVSNNPRAKFWETPSDGSYIGNKELPLSNLVRASAAAPHYFEPELIDIVAGETPGLFFDGAVSPHNNPSLQLLLTATLEGYGLGWKTGADQLLLVSVGTGSFRTRISTSSAQRLPAATLAVQALTGMIGDAQSLTLVLLYWLSGQGSPWPLNSEIGRLEHDSPPGGAPALTFRRYDIHLENDWLAAQLQRSFSVNELQRLQALDEPDSLQRLYEIACIAAEKFVHPDDFAAWT